MNLQLPNELLLTIMNIVLVTESRPERENIARELEEKAPFQSIADVSQSCKQLRQVALAAWFKSVSIRGREDWVTVREVFPGMLDWARHVRCEASDVDVEMMNGMRNVYSLAIRGSAMDLEQVLGRLTMPLTSLWLQVHGTSDLRLFNGLEHHRRLVHLSVDFDSISERFNFPSRCRTVATFITILSRSLASLQDLERLYIGAYLTSQCIIPYLHRLLDDFGLPDGHTDDLLQSGHGWNRFGRETQLDEILAAEMMGVRFPCLKAIGWRSLFAPFVAGPKSSAWGWSVALITRNGEIAVVRDRAEAEDEWRERVLMEGGEDSDGEDDCSYGDLS